MEAVIIVTVLALLQYNVFGILAAQTRGKAGINAPVMTGEPMVDRSRRVHQNTLEQLVFFIPVLWMFAYFINPLWAAGFGAVYLVGRMVFRAAYLKEPGSRTIGFSMTFMPSAIMAVWLLIKALLSYI